jgi:uncharacterized membrane protein
MWTVTILITSAGLQAASWILPEVTGIMGTATWQTLPCGPLIADAGDFIDRLMRANVGWYIFWMAVLASLLAVTYYVILKIRAEPEKKEPLASQWLSKYREMHSRGELSDEEFRTIRTKLAEQLQDELKDNGETS